MTRKTFAILGFAMLATGGICAADVPPMRSALIPDITVMENDSPLVRAAKLVAATRARMTMHSTHVIDNDSLRRAGSSHFSIATTEPAPVPGSRAPVTNLGPSPPAAPVSPYRQQTPNQTFVPPNTAPVVPTSPFQLPPPPPTSSPIPYRPPQ
jgi:hypothetical protein